MTGNNGSIFENIASWLNKNTTVNKALSPLLQISLCTLGCLYASSTQAQVTSDGTVNTQVTQNGNVAEITGGETRGSNLFHSFQDFSVPTNNEAFFNNANEISNIFSRVTGGNISNIDGAIRANGSANLFLINPAGIVFGQNARLNIGGSFYGSSASSILFEDGEFSAADLENPPLLTVNAPIGLSFRDNPAPINIERQPQGSADFNPAPSFDDNLFGLRVPDGKTFGLAGGDITADGGGIVAVGGRIELGAVGESGTLGINFEGDNINFNFPDDLARANVSLINNAGFLVSGSGGGDLAITSNNIEISDGSGLFAGIFSGLGSPDAQAGDITINVLNSINLTQNSSIDNNVGNFSSSAIGNSGNITIDANSVTVLDGSQIRSFINGIGGNSGKITINADSVEFAGRNAGDFPSGAFSFVGAGSVGNAGGIDINANTLVLSDRAQLLSNTDGVGNGGDINLQISNETRLLSSSILTEVSAPTEDNPGGFGIGGDINLTTGSLFLLNGSALLADLENEGSAGNININARDSFVLEGRGNAFFTDFGITPSQISSTVESQAVGNGGNIKIQTPFLTVKDTTFISVTSEGDGSAGIIDIEAGKIELADRGSILAETLFGKGGNILLDVNNILSLRNNSLVSAQAFNDASGGNVNIDADFIIAFPNQIDGNGSDIIASAVQGEGGEININAQSLFGIEEREAIDDNQTNDIDASSDFGLDGTVSIFTPDINPIQGVTELPSNVVETEETVAQACRRDRLANSQSGLTIEGKGGIPPEPGLPLDSHNIFVSGQANPQSTIPAPIETAIGKIQPARGVIVTESGEIILTAYRTNNAGDRLTEIKPNCS